MIIFLCILYIVNGLIIAVWEYKDSYKAPMEYLERTGKLTLLRKSRLVISLIGIILLVTIIWPAWAVITICKMYIDK